VSFVSRCCCRVGFCWNYYVCERIPAVLKSSKRLGKEVGYELQGLASKGTKEKDA
jgi:hypothetical protein